MKRTRKLACVYSLKAESVDSKCICSTLCLEAGSSLFHVPQDSSSSKPVFYPILMQKAWAAQFPDTESTLWKTDTHMIQRGIYLKLSKIAGHTNLSRWPKNLSKSTYGTTELFFKWGEGSIQSNFIRPPWSQNPPRVNAFIHWYQLPGPHLVTVICSMAQELSLICPWKCTRGLQRLKLKLNCLQAAE